jgi:hypothetical protein
MVGRKPSEARKRAGKQNREKQCRNARVSLPDVRRLRYFGLVSDSLKPLALQAELELGELLTDKGEGVTAAERTILEDCARLGLILRAEFARYLQSQDPVAAARVTALAGQRRASLQAVGLERVAKEIDLAEYLKRKAAEKASETSTGASPGALNGTNSDEDDSGAADARKGAPVASGGGAPGLHSSSGPAAVSTSTSTDTQED